MTKWKINKTYKTMTLQQDFIGCPHEESLGSELPIERTAKTLIRLGGCPG